MPTRRTFISFLGTTRYEEVTYTLDGYSYSTRYVSQAILQAIARDWTERDRAFFFVTEEAKRKNWSPSPEDSTHGPGLEAVLRSSNYPFQYRTIEIPHGFSEAEIWQLFYTIYHEIPKNSALYIDITNAFRTIPILFTVLIPYARATKGVTVEGIYYGAFEVLGPPREIPKKYPKVEDRKVPILQLAVFAELQEISYSVRTFLDTGKADLIVRPLEQGVKNATDEERRALIDIKELFRGAKILHDNIATCRGKVLLHNSAGKSLHQRIQSLLHTNVDKTTFLASIKPLFSKVQDKIKSLPAAHDSLSALWYAIDYAIRYRMTQQGLTLLREGFAVALLVDLYSDCAYSRLAPEKVQELKSILHRIEKSSATKTKSIAQGWDKTLLETIAIIFFYILPQNKEGAPHEWRVPSEEHRTLLLYLLQHHPFVLELRQKELKSQLDRLYKLRNDINHAGFTDSATGDAQKFHKNLVELWRTFQPILQRHFP